MPVSVVKLNTEARDQVNRFLALPFRLYRNCAAWVPPLLDDIRLQLNRRQYPFYEHSEANFFIAQRDGRDVARVAVLENRHYNAHWNSRTAFFSLFEVEEDPEVVQTLFAAIEDWACGRGLTRMVGAKGFLQGDGIGILVEGFEHRPAVGIPYNLPYYGSLIEAAGYRRQRDFLSAYLPGAVQLPEKVHQIAGLMKERRGFSIKTFETKDELRAWIPRIIQTYNDTFLQNWEFNPITEREGQVIGERLLQIADPRLIKLVMKGDAIAGFLFGFPDISEGIKRSGGRIWPFGWFWLLREFRRTRWINLNGAGILPAYRGLGVNAILYSEMEKTIRDGRFDHADIVQMEESVLTVDDAMNLGASIYKRHRIYEKSLTSVRPPDGLPSP
jgi:hypothetical protein